MEAKTTGAKRVNRYSALTIIAKKPTIEYITAEKNAGEISDLQYAEPLPRKG
jgi:hypothetical protein